jgi:hypothetical protein
MTITEVYYSESKFRGLPEGKWPVKPKHDVKCHSSHACICSELAFESGANRYVVDSYDDNCPHRYQKALTSALERSVPFEDKEAIETIICMHKGYFECVELTEGKIYTIPATEVEVVEVPEEDSGVDGSGPPYSPVDFKRVAHIKPVCEEKEECECSEFCLLPISKTLNKKCRIKPSPKIEEETQEELWEEALDYFGNLTWKEGYNHLLKHFHITRKTNGK